MAKHDPSCKQCVAGDKLFLRRGASDKCAMEAALRARQVAGPRQGRYLLQLRETKAAFTGAGETSSAAITARPAAAGSPARTCSSCWRAVSTTSFTGGLASSRRTRQMVRYDRKQPQVSFLPDEGGDDSWERSRTWCVLQACLQGRPVAPAQGRRIKST